MRVYRVLNLSAGLRRPFLSNRLSSEDGLLQGLSSVSLSTLLLRRKIMLLPYGNQEGRRFGPERSPEREGLIKMGWPWVDEAEISSNQAWSLPWEITPTSPSQYASMLINLPANEVAITYKTGLDPTSEDLHDMSLIDRLYSQSDPAKQEDPFYIKFCLPGGAPWLNQELKSHSVIQIPEVKGGFYCSSWAKEHGYDVGDIPFAVVWWGLSPGSFPYGESLSLRANFYGIEPSRPWGELKQTTLNVSTFDAVLRTYPFPPPFESNFTTFWSELAVPSIRDFVAIQTPIDADVARVFITFSILDNYAKMVENIKAYFEDEKRDMKRQAVTIGIASLALGGLLALVALPVAAALAVKVVVAGAGAITKVQSAELSKALNDVAGAFEEEAPAFANEVRFAGEWQKKAVANIQDAIGRGDRSAALPSMSSGLKTGLLIAGGLAAVGGIAYLIVKK